MYEYGFASCSAFGLYSQEKNYRKDQYCYFHFAVGVLYQATTKDGSQVPAVLPRKTVGTKAEVNQNYGGDDKW